MAAEGLPVQMACRLLSVAESGYYEWPAPGQHPPLRLPLRLPRVALGHDVVATVATWLDCNRGLPAEPRLHQLPSPRSNMSHRNGSQNSEECFRSDQWTGDRRTESGRRPRRDRRHWSKTSHC
jgi:hypothetical protein